MECKDTRKTLSAYLEGVISPGEKKGIEDHLKVCPSCRTALEDLKKAMELVQGLKEVEPPSWLSKKIMTRIREEEGRKGGILRKLFYPLHIKVPIQAMATVFIAVTALYLFYSMEPEVQKMQAPAVTEPVAPRHEAWPEPRPPAAVTIPEAGKAPPPLLQEAERKAKEPRPKEILREKEGEETLPRGEDSKPRATEPLFPREKKEMLAEQKDTVKGDLEVPRLRKAPQPQYDHAPAPRKEETYAAPPPDMKAGMKERGALSSAPPVGALASKMPEPFLLTVRVQDVQRADREVETLLTQLGAKRIEKEVLEGRVVVKAALKTERLKEFRNQLNHFGEVQEKGTFSPALEGEAFIQIEIVSNR